MNNVANLLKNHTSANNGNDYEPIYDESTNSLSPTWFAIHNPGTSPTTITVWTIDQGDSGSGVDISINGGDTFYVYFKKITVSTDVVLIGRYSNMSR